MIDHCIAVFKKKAGDRLFKTYLTDVLKAIADNTGRNGGFVMKERYADVAFRDNNEPEKTGDEIALEVIKRAGLRVKT